MIYYSDIKKVFLNKFMIKIKILLILLVLVGCTTSWNGVVLPTGCSQFSFSPQVDWVSYECEEEIWVAPLPNLQDSVLLTSTDDNAISWALDTHWLADGSGIIMRSSNFSEQTQDWWLTKVDDFTSRIHLCSLPLKAYIIVSTLASNVVTVVGRDGSVILVYTDGRGCQELSISGLYMLMPTISLSPDGDRIAYSTIQTNSDEQLVGQVSLLDLNTSETEIIYRDGGSLEWFPDGMSLYLIDGLNTVHIFRADGSGTVSKVEFPGNWVINKNRGISWSPDGSFLALYLETEGPAYDPMAIGLLNKETMTSSIIEVSYFHEILGWTRDGNALIVLATRSDGSQVLREVDVRHNP